MKWSTWNIPHLGYFSLFSACGVALGWWELVRRHTFVLVCLSKGVPANAVVVTNSTPCWYTTTKDGLWIAGEWWAVAPAISASQVNANLNHVVPNSATRDFTSVFYRMALLICSPVMHLTSEYWTYIELRYLVIDTPTPYAYVLRPGHD